MSLLMLASKKGRAATVQALLEQPGLQVYHRDQKGKNAAHYAIENADEEEGAHILGMLLRTYPELVAIDGCRERWEIFPRGIILRWPFGRGGTRWCGCWWRRRWTRATVRWRVGCGKRRFGGAPRGGPGPPQPPERGPDAGYVADVGAVGVPGGGGEC